MADRGLTSDFGGPVKRWKPPSKKSSTDSGSGLKSMNGTISRGSYNPRNSDRSLTADFGENSNSSLTMSPIAAARKTVGSSTSPKSNKGTYSGHNSDRSLTSDFGNGSFVKREPDVKARTYGSSVTKMMDASSFDRSFTTGESDAHNQIIQESVAERKRRIMQLFSGKSDQADIDAEVELDRQKGTFQARMNRSTPFSFSPDDLVKKERDPSKPNYQDEEYSIREEEDEDEIFEQSAVDPEKEMEELKRLDEQLNKQRAEEEKARKAREEEEERARRAREEEEETATKAWQEKKRLQREEYERERQRVEEKEARKMEKKLEEANRRAMEKMRLEDADTVPAAPQLEEPDMGPAMASKPADVSVIDSDKLIKKKKKRNPMSQSLKVESPVVKNSQYMKSMVSRSVSTRAILEYAKECEQEVVVEGSQIPHSAATLKDVPLEQRENHRAARLAKAMERIERQKEEAAMRELEMMPEIRMRERKDMAYQKYLNHGMPTKKELARLIKMDRDGRVSEEDLDLLPWMDGDFVVDRAAMK